MMPTTPPEFPEVPYPFTPHQPPPRREEPVAVPMVEMPSTDIYRRLFERRRLLMSGPLDRDAVTRLCAGLMALDGQSGDDVELVINSEGGPLAEASAVLDVIELMRAPVNTTCVGAARGTAGIVVACGTGRRRAAHHATISLRCDHPESIQGSAADIDRAVRALDAMRHRMQQALVVATGQSPETIAAEIEHGAIHDAPAALALHLIDEITDGR